MTQRNRSRSRLRLHRGALDDLPLLRPARRSAPGRRCEGLAGLVEDALLQSHPALSAMLGPERAAGLAQELVASHPFYAGEGQVLAEILPGFLEVALHEEALRAEWMLDLVRLEGAIAAAGRAPAAPPRGSAAPGPAVGARLAPAPSLHLLQLAYDVDDVYQAILERRPWLEPVERSSHLAVYRHGTQTRRMQLARPACLLLGELADGRPVAEAEAAAFELVREDGWSERAFHRRAALWLRLWVAESLLVPSQSPAEEVRP